MFMFRKDYENLEILTIPVSNYKGPIVYKWNILCKLLTIKYEV